MEKFRQNLPQIFIIRVRTAEKVFKVIQVKGQGHSHGEASSLTCFIEEHDEYDDDEDDDDKCKKRSL